MNLKNLLEQIKETCTFCERCDPCCTRNILKKCIENDRVVSRDAGAYASVDLAPSYSTAA
jgi:hypothetical protein